jgi:hypothetical protein
MFEKKLALCGLSDLRGETSFLLEKRYRKGNKRDKNGANGNEKGQKRTGRK